MVQWGAPDHQGQVWRDPMEAHIEHHVCLLMHSHAQVETWLHSGELGAVQVVGDDNNNDPPLGQ